MDHVVRLFADDLVLGQDRIRAATDALLARSRPDLAQRVAKDVSLGDDPLLLAHLTSPGESGCTLDQLVFGRLPRDAQPEEVPVLAAADGSVELPGLGLLQTNRPMAALTVSDRGSLAVREGGRPTSFDLGPASASRRHTSAVVDLGVGPPLRRFAGLPLSARVRKPTGAVADLEGAFEMLSRVQPEFARSAAAAMSRVVLFDNPHMNSFAAPQAQGAVFFNLHHGRGRICHLEDLLHQAGHVVFQAMTLDPSSVLSRDPDMPMPGDDAEDRRTAYVVLHAVVTERWMARGLLTALTSERLEDLERAEVVGRLAFILSRYAADLSDLVAARVVTERGQQLVDVLVADLRRVLAETPTYLRGLSLKGQPYNFSLEAFLEANPSSPWSRVDAR